MSIKRNDQPELFRTLEEDDQPELFRTLEDDRPELFLKVDDLILKRRKLHHADAPVKNTSVEDYLRSYSVARELLAEAVHNQPDLFCLRSYSRETVHNQPKLFVAKDEEIKTQDKEIKTQPSMDDKSTVLLTVQNNMCGGGGFRQDTQYLVQWTAVKDTIVGQRFGSNQPDFLHLNSDMSVPHLASPEHIQIDECVQNLIAKGDCIYDAEMDNGEGAETLAKLKEKKDLVAPTRFVIYRTFS
jgi:hypothetical protein